MTRPSPTRGHDHERRHGHKHEHRHETDSSAHLEDGTALERTDLEPAAVRRANVAATAVTETLRSTLGPNGRNKMLVGRQGKVVVTNDGTTVLDALEIADPVANALVDVAQTQDAAVGDGTTTGVLLTGELLAAAETLLEDGIHPTTIVAGYGTAARRARAQLDEYAQRVDPTDDETLRAVARTAVTNDWDEASIDRFADLAVRAARTVEFDTDSLTQKAYSGGTLRDSELLEGVAIDLETSSTTVERDRRTCAATVSDARIALVSHEVSVDEADAVTAPTVTSPDDLERLREAEQTERSSVVDRLCELNVDSLVCHQSVDERIRERLERAGVIVVERTRRDEFDALAAATDARVAYAVDDLNRRAIGRAGTVERRPIGSTPVLVVADCPSDAAANGHATLLLRGGTPHVADETRRIVDDCLAVVTAVARDGAVVPGGGAAAMALADDLATHARQYDSREQRAIDAFATALESIPRILATNAGRDPLDVVAELRAKHADGWSSAGVGADGAVEAMDDQGVLEPRAVLDRTLATAFESTATILRIDDVLTNGESGLAGRDRDDTHTHGHNHGHGHGRGSRVRSSTGGYPWAIGH